MVGMGDTDFDLEVADIGWHLTDKSGSNTEDNGFTFIWLRKSLQECRNLSSVRIGLVSSWTACKLREEV